jgi:hypothetical protein
MKLYIRHNLDPKVGDCYVEGNIKFLVTCVDDDLICYGMFYRNWLCNAFRYLDLPEITKLCHQVLYLMQKPAPYIIPG